MEPLQSTCVVLHQPLWVMILNWFGFGKKKEWGRAWLSATAKVLSSVFSSTSSQSWVDRNISLFLRKGKKGIGHCNWRETAASEFEFPTEFHIHGTITIKRIINCATKERKRNLVMLTIQLPSKKRISFFFSLLVNNLRQGCPRGRLWSTSRSWRVQR